MEHQQELTKHIGDCVSVMVHSTVLNGVSSHVCCALCGTLEFDADEWYWIKVVVDKQLSYVTFRVENVCTIGVADGGRICIDVA